MRRWIIPVLALVAAAITATAITFAMTGGGGDDPPEEPAALSDDASNDGSIRPPDGIVGDGPGLDEGPAGEPLEEPPLPLDDACDPVPLRSDCGIDPSECNEVHNIDACEPNPLLNGSAVFDVSIQYNASVTQEDMADVEDVLLAYDGNADLLVLEIFPPIGRGIIATDDLEFCSVVIAQLKAESYVDSVSCEPAQPTDHADPDAPISHPAP